MKKIKKGKFKMIIGIVLVMIISVLVWFFVPYSPLKNEFVSTISNLKASNAIDTDKDYFKAEEFEHLPTTIQKYIQNSGFINTQKMSYMKMEYHDVTFVQGRGGLSLNIDYIQYNYVHDVARFAFIDSSFYMIPFQGFDYFNNGIGGMKGVLGKAITLFDQTGTDMDKACLVTYLAESLFVPSAILEGNIEFNQIYEYEVEATMTYKNISVSGVFKFNDRYEMISLKTNDRAVANTDGSIEYVPWSVKCDDYTTNENGIKLPSKFQAIWNYEDEDFVYFDGSAYEIVYDYND